MENQIYNEVRDCPNITIFFKTPEEMASFIDGIEDSDLSEGRPVFVRNVDETFFNRMLYSLPGELRFACRPIPVYNETGE